MAVRLDFELAGIAFCSSLPLARQRIYGPVLEADRYGSPNCPAGLARCGEGRALAGQHAMSPGQMQEALWKQYFADTTQWWDNRRSKPSPRHPDFKHRESKTPLWLNNRHKPGWVDSQLATMDAALKTSLDSGGASPQRPAASAATQGLSEVAMCRKLCEDGLVSDAVNALERLVQQGCRVPNNLFYHVLKRCIQDKDTAVGKRVHDLSVEAGYEGDAFLATHLIGLYASHGSLEKAMGVFTKVSTPDAYNWATIIFAYARHGEAAEAAEAIRLYRQMRESTTVKPDDRLYSAILKACAAARDLVAGREVHAHILASPGKPDKFVQAGLVNMYAKCGGLGEARSLFDKLVEKDVVTWTSMIAAYAQQGMGEEAFNLYRSMRQEGFSRPNSVTYVCLLEACAGTGSGALNEGKQLHAEIKARGLEKDATLAVNLVHMYVKCGSLNDARRVFDMLSEKDVVTWTVLIAGYVQEGMGQEALKLYKGMQQDGLTPPDSVTYVCLLQACAALGVGALDEGKQLHVQIRKQGLQDDVVVGGSLINMYAKCGSLGDARSQFDELPEKNVVAWNAMIAGYAQRRVGQEALSLYSSMQREGLTANRVTFVSLLQACASIGVGALGEGKQLHAQITELGLEDDVILGGGLVNMHAKCGNLEDARSVFEKLPERNLLAWNAMITGYAQQGFGQEALQLHSRMQQDGMTPDFVTYLCLLQACANVGIEALEKGRQLHAQIEKQGLQEDAVLGGCLVNMYAKSGSLEDASAVFEKLTKRDVVTWTAMIAGYTQQGVAQDALSLYNRMQQEGCTPDAVTYSCLLQACAAVAALPLGEQLHTEVEEKGMQADPMVGADLVNMYAKCGSMYDAQRVFDALPARSSEAWAALVSGYARQGDSQVVFDLVDRMKAAGVQPNESTFLSVLTVCSHAGLVDKGLEYFEAMRTGYGISATMQHYICMVDLLGRAGHLQEALHMAKTMPFPANDVVWHTLLGACRKWKNVEIGQQAFESAVSADEKDAVSYVLMANIYASTQMWERAKEMQAKRTKFGAWKKPGQSWWTDMAGVVHTFLVGDKKHPESDAIYARLEQVIPRIKKAGYVPLLESSLLNRPDDEKLTGLCGHSEKLAIAYALSKTPEGTTIRIVKNLRVCEDCHTATAYISKVEKRTIICRDSSRFHVFSDGQCSCGDYW